jgi:hypothetical protein
MVNRPKNIGTATETAVVRYLRAHGFIGAERRALAGSADLGDVVGIPGVVVEVKGGKAAEVASDAQITAWMAETELERRHAKAEVGLLVRKRKAVGAANAGQWHAHLSSHTIAALVGPNSITFPDAPNVVVTVSLAAAVRLLRWAGYGDALDPCSMVAPDGEDAA